MSYLGNSPDNQTFLSGTDYFSGNGSTVLFTLSREVISVNDIIVVVENVVQYPGVAYSVIGNQLTFTGAPQSGTNNIYVRYMSVNTRSIGVSDGAITTPKIQDAAVTSSKVATGVAVSNIGYTPVNKAGDTMTGPLVIQSDNNILTLESTDASARATLKLNTNGNDWEVGARGSANNTHPNALYIYDNAASAFRMVIDSAGRVTMPNQPAIHAYVTGSMPSINDGGQWVPQFTATRFTKGMSIDGSGFITVPVSGLYRVVTSLESLCTSGAYSVRALSPKLRVNGTQYMHYGQDYWHSAASTYATNFHWTFDNEYLLQLSAGDQLSIQNYMYHNKGSALTESYSNDILVQLIS